MRALAFVAVLACASAASAQSVSEANQRVEQGEQLFLAGDYDAALAEFERAYELIGEHPSRYLILYNIGKAHERRFRYDLALRYYRRYLEEGGPGAPDRGAVTASISELERLLATVRVEVNVPAATVWLGDRQVGEAPGEVLVPGGRHVLEVRAPGYAPERREIQVAPRTASDERFSLTPYGRGLDPVFFWSATVATVVIAATGGAVGIGALARRADIDTQLMDDALRWRIGDDERAELEQLTLSADILFGTAGLFAVASVVLAILTDFGGPPSRETARVVPMLDRSGGGLAAEVTF